jgi:NTE family protein
MECGGDFRGLARRGHLDIFTGALQRSVQPKEQSGCATAQVELFSPGAVVGCLAAGGLTGDRLKQKALSLDHAGFKDPTPLDGVPIAGKIVALLQGSGVYQGDYAHEWVRSQLAELGIHTLGDLKIDDDSLPPERRYKLVVTASDLTLGQLVRLPWDYSSVYGLDPDKMPVADAVRASTA